MNKKDYLIKLKEKLGMVLLATSLATTAPAMSVQAEEVSYEQPTYNPVEVPAVGSREYNILYATIAQEGGCKNYNEATAITDVLINRARANNTSIYEELTAPGQFSAYLSGAYKRYLDANGNLIVYENYDEGIKAGKSYFITEECVEAIDTELSYAVLGYSVVYSKYYSFNAPVNNNGTFTKDGNHFRTR